MVKGAGNAADAHDGAVIRIQFAFGKDIEEILVEQLAVEGDPAAVEAHGLGVVSHILPDNLGIEILLSPQAKLDAHLEALVFGEASGQLELYHVVQIVFRDRAQGVFGSILEGKAQPVYLVMLVFGEFVVHPQLVFPGAGIGSLRDEGKGLAEGNDEVVAFVVDLVNHLESRHDGQFRGVSDLRAFAQGGCLETAVVHKAEHRNVVLQAGRQIDAFRGRVHLVVKGLAPIGRSVFKEPYGTVLPGGVKHAVRGGGVLLLFLPVKREQAFGHQPALPEADIGGSRGRAPFKLELPGVLDVGGGKHRAGIRPVVNGDNAADPGGGSAPACLGHRHHAVIVGVSGQGVGIDAFKLVKLVAGKDFLALFAVLFHPAGAVVETAGCEIAQHAVMGKHGAHNVRVPGNCLVEGAVRSLVFFLFQF